ncbi:hypothetical protein [Streptomyces sp. NPDC093707]|uniref:hypothetical protein n=1 Tax=Streptomyces sp. NPDC093707 TaxID=3154984 RepID=UPI00344CBC82
MILTSRSQVSPVSWIKPLGWSTVLGVLVTVTVAVLCALLPQAHRAESRGEEVPHERVHLAAVALPLCAVPQIGLALISLVQPLYVTRYVLFASVGLALCLGVLLVAIAARLRTRARILLPAAVVLALVARLPIELRLRTVESRVEDVLTAAATVAHVQGDERSEQRGQGRMARIEAECGSRRPRLADVALQGVPGSGIGARVQDEPVSYG